MALFHACLDGVSVLLRLFEGFICLLYRLKIRVMIRARVRVVFLCFLLLFVFRRAWFLNSAARASAFFRPSSTLAAAASMIAWDRPRRQVRVGISVEVSSGLNSTLARFQSLLCCLRGFLLSEIEGERIKSNQVKQQ